MNLRADTRLQRCAARLQTENEELKLKNFQLAQFCEASAEGFDNLNNKIAELKEEIEADACYIALKEETISFLNNEEKKMRKRIAELEKDNEALKKEKNNVWDRNTQLKFDMDKLEKKIERQQETITEQRKDIVRLREYEVIVKNDEGGEMERQKQNKKTGLIEGRCCSACDYEYMNSDLCRLCL